MAVARFEFAEEELRGQRSSRRSLMARLSGRAPNCEVEPFLGNHCLAERSTPGELLLRQALLQPRCS